MANELQKSSTELPDAPQSVSETSLHLPEIDVDEGVILEELKDDRSYAMTASLWSRITAWIQLVIWFVALVGLCWLAFAKSAMRIDYPIIYWGTVSLVAILMLVYVRLLQIHFHHLSDYICIVRQGIRGAIHRKRLGLFWFSCEHHTYAWDAIGRVSVDKVNTDRGGTMLVLEGTDGKRLARLDMTYLSYGKKKLAKAVRENSGRDIFAD